MNFLKLFSILILVGAFVGCDSSSSSSDDSSSNNVLSSLDVSSIPSVSSMVSSSSASTSSLSTQAVSGTAPLITTLQSNYDTYFWNGLITTINNAGSATAAQASEFFGGVNGGAGGEVACRMAQSVGENLGRMLSAGGSLCYMKALPSAASGVTITSGTLTQSELFTQTAADKRVRVSTGNDYVNLLIEGTNTTGSSNIYRVRLHFCSDTNSSTTPRSYEVITVDRSTGVMTSSNHGTENSETWESSVSAGLTTDSSGNVVFDSSQDRTAVFKFSDGSNRFIGQMIVSSDTITSRMYNTYSSTEGSNTFTGSEKIYAVANFSGSSLADLRFLQGGVTGQSTFSMVSGSTTVIDDSHSFVNATEWQDTHYVAVASGTYYDNVSAITLSTDSFLGTPQDPSTYDASSYDCGVSPDAEVTMNFSDSAVAAIDSSCQEDRFNDYQMCNQSGVEQARQYIWQAGP